MHISKGRSQSAVLHSYLYAESNTLRLLQTQQASYRETQREPKQVVKHDDKDDNHSAKHQAVGIVRHNDSHRNGNRQRREGRQIGRDSFRELGQEMLAQQSHNDGCYHHIDNAQQHSQRIDINHRTSHQPDEQRRHNGSE